jgi:hypothetical protein
LRTDDFKGFFDSRKGALLALVEQSMDKHAVVTSEPSPENGSELDDDEE